ncbi:MAG: hypothetical protein AAF597_21540, partial [Bacteroidota bacterium]
MRILFFLCLFCACATSRPQATTESVDFYLDPLGKAYFLLGDGQLITSNPLGQNTFNFFDSSLGAPDVIDVTNNFAILLYYADYATVVVLDRTLNEISRLDFFEFEAIEQPTTLARATDNGIWLFDSWDYRLKLIDQRGNISQQSNDLRLSIKAVEAPDRIYVYQNLVLLYYQEDAKLAIFTNYGRFDRWVTLPAAEQFGYHDGRLLGQTEEELWVWDIRTLRVKRAEGLEEPRTQVQWE